MVITAADVREWPLVISGSITLLSVAISSWLALRQYRLKLKEEERLSVSARTEIDIKLVKAFVELMDMAHGRSGHVLSEKTVEFLLAHNFVPDSETSDPSAVSRKLENAAIFSLPVGQGCQEAAIAAITVLGKRHDVLRDLAFWGLASLKMVRPDIIPTYIERLERAG
jgi:hypothetical protein